MADRIRKYHGDEAADAYLAAHAKGEERAVKIYEGLTLSATFPPLNDGSTYAGSDFALDVHTAVLAPALKGSSGRGRRLQNRLPGDAGRRSDLRSRIARVACSLKRRTVFVFRSTLRLGCSFDAGEWVSRHSGRGSRGALRGSSELSHPYRSSRRTHRSSTRTETASPAAVRLRFVSSLVARCVAGCA